MDTPTSSSSSSSSPSSSDMDVMVARKQQTDWYSWLGRTGLDSRVVYRYSVLFAENELDEGDVAHFDHPFLQSMGIAIAKHRLQILKLARTADAANKPILVYLLRPVSRFVTSTVRKTRRRFAEMLRRDGRKKEEIPADDVEVGKKAALVVVQRPTEEALMGAMLKRSRSLGLLGSQRRLMVASGRTKIAAAYGHRHSCREPRSRNHLLPRHAVDADVNAGTDEVEEEEEGEMGWDSMFRDMKPN